MENNIKQLKNAVKRIKKVGDELDNEGYGYLVIVEDTKNSSYGSSHSNITNGMIINFIQDAMSKEPSVYEGVVEVLKEIKKPYLN